MCGILDSACNKSLVGSITLDQQAEASQKNWGVEILYEPAEDCFKFGDAEELEVARKRPSVRSASRGILGRSTCVSWRGRTLRC